MAEGRRAWSVWSVECGVDARKWRCRFGSSAADAFHHTHIRTRTHTEDVPATGLQPKCGEPGEIWWHVP